MSAENEAAQTLVRAIYAAIAAREIDSVKPLLDDGVSIEEVTGSDRVELGRGRGALTELLARYDDQFAEFRMEPLEAIVLDGKVMVEVRIGGIGISGAEQWSTGYHVHTLAAGKVMRIELFANREDAAGAIRLAETS